MGSMSGYLRDFDDAYDKAEAPQYGSLPDGKYQVTVDRAYLKQNTVTGSWGLQLDLMVIDGQYEGRYIFKWQSVDEPNRMDYLKGDLNLLGYTGRLSELEDNLNQLLDARLEVTLKTTPSKKDPSKEYQNTYLNKNLSSDAPAKPKPVQSAGGRKFNDDPFASDVKLEISDDDLPF